MSTLSMVRQGRVQMNEEAMLGRLEDHHRAIVAGLTEIRRHCGASHPHSGELAAARERLTAASLARSRYVSEEVVPALLKDPNRDGRGA